MAADQGSGRLPDLDPAPLGFRPLERADLPLLYRWLTTPHVARWYQQGEPRTLAGVEAKYGPRIDGRTPTRAFVILYDETPIGYIQTYLIGAYPDYARHVAADEVAAGVDLFIGETGYVHRGLGAPLLRAFLRDVVFTQPGVVSCIIGPEPKNAAAIRAYEKAGFGYLKTIQLADEPEPEWLMRLAKSELA
jgi:RimJ/RimL family protein N-acetyltransferase